jgi:tetratricopeptide (TPR) repeat protein
MRDRLEAELSDRYAIERELGHGGMATVWLARDRSNDRFVAIKVLHSELAGAVAGDRFAREVRVTSRLQHPSIVPVLDSGVLPATHEVALPWYAMPYVAGESLRSRLAREVQLPVAEALRITREIASALQAAHGAGVIHRDIKPENIIVGADRTYVVDFGIAKALAETGDERLTSTGLALGTPAYMSPEQATAATIDARSDQYSLAAVLYEMLAGEPPVTGPNAQAIIARRLAEPARPIRSVRQAVPEAIEQVVLKALERVPADRFPNIDSFAEELERAARSSRSFPWRRRVVWTLAAAGGLTIAGAAAWTALGRSSRGAGPARDPELMTLYRRGIRGYEQRTTTGAVDAIQSFKAVLARDSTYAPAWAGLAKTYVRVVVRQFQIRGLSQDSSLRLAVLALDRALALDTTDADVWAGRAAVSRRVDPTDVGPAVRAARKAIALDARNGEAWHYLALSLAEQGEMDAALDAWRECVRRNPSYLQGLAFMAQAHYWHKQFDSAAVWADSAIAVDPNYLQSRVTLGQVEVERGNFARALAAFDAGLRLSTDVESAHAIAGRALVEARTGRVRDARATLRQVDSLARTFSPTPLHVAVWVAQPYAALGDVERAVWWLKQYSPQDDLHYQLHIRCDRPFAVLSKDPRYRALLRAPPKADAC